MSRPIITLLTDFGLHDHYVAAMKGVILRICPESCLVDISHEIEPFGIQQGAWTLSQAWEWFPQGTIHLVVVDPGVGSARRAIAAKVAGHFFVGPDNGVLTYPLLHEEAYKAFQLTDAAWFGRTVSNTFHGRDIFAPVAAHLANGLAISTLGPSVEDALLLPAIQPVASGPGRWTGLILAIDRFGNAVTNFPSNLFGWVSVNSFELVVGSEQITVYRQHYSQAPAGEYFITQGSAGFLELSLNRSAVSSSLSLRAGASIQLRRKT